MVATHCRALAVTALVGAGLGAGAWACSSFDEDPSGAGEDAGSESAATDSEVPVDAAPAGDVEAGARPFCEDAGHDFCADFDTVASINDVGFTIAEIVGTGAAPALVTDAAALSPPGALRATLERETVPTQPAYHASRWSVQEVYAGGPSRAAVKVSFDMLVERADETDFGVFAMAIESPRVTLYLERRPPDSDLTVMATRFLDGGEVFEPIGPKIAVGVWTRVTVDITPRAADPSGAGATISLGGVGTTLQLESQELPALFRADIGIVARPAGGNWTVFFDNVSMDWK